VADKMCKPHAFW